MLFLASFKIENFLTANLIIYTQIYLKYIRNIAKRTS